MLFTTYLPDFMSGLWLTTASSFLSFAAGLVLGVLGAQARRSRLRPLRLLGTIYVEVIRNTPALVQIFIVYFGLPVVGIRLPAFVAGVIALSVNAGAYLTEIMRTGIEAVPAGQLEAARTLGLSARDSFFHVVLPQAVRTVYPPVVNEFIQIILGSSLLSVVSLNELTSTAQIVNSLTFRTMETFGTSLVLYLILTNLVSLAANLLAKAIFRPGLQPAAITRRRYRASTRNLLGAETH